MLSVFKYLETAIADRSGPPKHEVALMAMRLAGQETQQKLLKANSQLALTLVAPLCRWISHFDYRLVEAAFEVLHVLMDFEQHQNKFLECGGMAAIINCVANLNVST